jgi:hypothetical protein
MMIGWPEASSQHGKDRDRMSEAATLVALERMTSATESQLVSTYFSSPRTQAESEHPKPKLTTQRGLFVLLVVSFAIGLTFSPFFHQVNKPVVTTIISFEEDAVLERLGQQFGLWWGSPGDPSQQIAVGLESNTHIGSEGHSLAINYGLTTPAGRVGIWFRLPAEAPNATELSFHIRGGLQGPYTDTVVMEVLGDTASKYVPVHITRSWQKITIPLDDTAAHTRWREARLLFDSDVITASHGRLLIDEVQFVRRR